MDEAAGILETVEEGLLPTPGGEVAIQIRLMAIAAAARFHGAELERTDLRVPAGDLASPAALTAASMGRLTTRGMAKRSSSPDAASVAAPSPSGK